MDRQHEFGNQLEQIDSKKGKWVLFGIFGTIAAVALAVFGVLLMFGDFYREFGMSGPSIPIGIGLIALGVFVIAVFFVIIGASKQTVTIFTDGVIVSRKRDTHQFHFSDIKGLSDVTASGVPIVVTGGVAGAIIGSIAGALANTALDANRRKNSLREVIIVPHSDASPVKVTNTAGDMLSEVYTAWLVKQQDLKAENIAAATISFGDTLEYKEGEFIQHHKRGERRLSVSNLTRVHICGEGEEIQLWGMNEGGKEKCIISVKLRQMYNVDLLSYVVDLHGDGGEE